MPAALGIILFVYSIVMPAVILVLVLRNQRATIRIGKRVLTLAGVNTDAVSLKELERSLSAPFTVRQASVGSGGIARTHFDPRSLAEQTCQLFDRFLERESWCAPLIRGQYTTGSCTSCRGYMSSP